MRLVKDDFDYSAYVAEPQAKTKVKRAVDYADGLVERFLMPDEGRGVYLPWRKANDQLRLRPNELTLWPGINGHGKSLLLNQIMLYAMAQSERVLIASMEMTPLATLERMTKQATRLANPSPREIRAFTEWTDNRLWIYDHIGSVNWRDLLGVMRYCAAELKITQFVIDSLMRCGIGEQDYDGQKAFIDALCTFRMDYPVHVHLVLHSRKREDELTPPGKFDAKGTGTITDLADNVITVWRNKRKEIELSKPLGQSNHDPTEPDALLICDKQRHHEWEGMIKLWYIPGCMQFTEFATSGPIELMSVGR